MFGQKLRLLGQILEKPCVHSRGHSFNPKFIKLCRNVNHHNIKVKFETWSCWIKIRSQGQQATQVSNLGPLWPSCYSVKKGNNSVNN